MESEAADLRPGWETEPRQGGDGMVRFWLGSGAFGIEGTGDGWWRVVDPAGHPVSEWSCFEGAQMRAESLEEAEAVEPRLPSDGPGGVPFAPLCSARVAHPLVATPDSTFAHAETSLQGSIGATGRRAGEAAPAEAPPPAAQRPPKSKVDRT